MDGYLAKPVNRAQLIATIEKHLLDSARATERDAALANLTITADVPESCHHL